MAKSSLVRVITSVIDKNLLYEILDIYLRFTLRIAPLGISSHATEQAQPTGMYMLVPDLLRMSKILHYVQRLVRGEKPE